jgi:hypothetical protein
MSIPGAVAKRLRMARLHTGGCYELGGRRAAGEKEGRGGRVIALSCNIRAAIGGR